MGDIVNMEMAVFGIDRRRLGSNFVEGVIMPEAFFFENRTKLPVKTFETVLSKVGENVEDGPAAIDLVP